MNWSHTRRSFVVIGLLFLVTVSKVTSQSIMLSTQSVAPCCVSDAISTGDFNNDGIPDIITTNGVFLGRGDGTFASPVSPNVAANASDIVVGDFNGDGNLDVAFVNSSMSLQILLGNGDGTFRAPETIILDGLAQSIATADFNHDGKLDLAVALIPASFQSVGATVAILQGDGAGHFSQVNALQLSVSVNPFAMKVRAGDFNADGQVDLAVLQQQMVSVWFGNGNFSFNQVMLNQYTEADDMSTGDVNQDGFTDILVAFAIPENPSGPSADVCCATPSLTGVDGYFGQPSRSLRFQRLIVPSDQFGGAHGVLAADVDGDGINDIVAQGLDTTSPATGYGLFVWKGNPDGTFQQSPTRFNYSGEAGGFDLAVADFNRDGKIDFATTDGATDFLHVFLNATPTIPCAQGTTNPSITICHPQDNTFSNSPLHVVAEATSSSASSSNPVASLDLFVDGTLEGQFTGPSIDQMLSLPDGDHLLVVKGLELTGASFLSDRHVTIFSGTPGETCPTSSQDLSVHICSPAQGVTVTSPVQVFANSYSVDIVTAIQVYIDGNLEFSDSTLTTWVNRPFPLSPGLHVLAVKAFDANGRQISDTRTFTVE